MSFTTICPPFDWANSYYTTVGSSCVRQQGFFIQDDFPLHALWTYPFLLAFVVLFAFYTPYVQALEEKHVDGPNHTSEWFNTAGRSIKTGLIASGVVSQWTWVNTIFQSSYAAWLYGVSGSFWVASGGTIQLLLFGIIAIEIKQKAPNAHTVCEIVRARWGKATHIVFLVFCFATNFMVTAILLLVGSAEISNLTGMELYYGILMIPVGVIIYTCIGGLKATFIARYFTSLFVHVVLLLFVFFMYASSINSELGSPSKVYDKLVLIESPTRNCTPPISYHSQACGPVKGNYGGSYLTMLSSDGLILGLINMVTSFGTIFLDNGYWINAIAARPSSTHKGYLLGGLVYFAVPFCLGTALGLGALALDLPLTRYEARWTITATATAFIGTRNAQMLLMSLILVVVPSTLSAQVIAVSSLYTYDIYRTYINPQATGGKLLSVSRYTVFAYGIFMCGLAAIVHRAMVTPEWLYFAMGVSTRSAVMPVAFLMLWRKANARGAMAGCIIGCITGIATWLIVTKAKYGTVNLETTGQNAPILTGNLVAILAGGAVHAFCSFLSPQDYEWDTTRSITLVDMDPSDFDVPSEEYAEENLKAARRYAIKWGIGLTVLIVIIWPILSLPAKVFNLGYFTFWAVITVAFALIASTIIIILPLVENWDIVPPVFLDLMSNWIHWCATHRCRTPF